jgi:RNA polymerase sigma-70 factor (ECF subfamily)
VYSLNTKTDEEIAKMVQGGDSEPFGVLVERYEQKLLRYGGKFLFNIEDVKDLVQEVFLSAYANIKNFDVSRKFSSWIYRIAHNEFINAVRKKTREKISFFDLDVIFPHPVARETADKEIKEAETKKQLDQTVAKLDLKYREPLILFYYEDKNYEEIAEILKIPVSTVGVRLRRAREFLKKINGQGKR